MTTDVSVVICAYTEARWGALLAAVDSVRRQTVPPLEVIVIVDHNPSLLDRARQALPTVCVAENAADRGLSGSRNSGLNLAHGSVVAFLDDDASAAPDWLEQLLAGYSDPNVIAVGGAIAPLWAAGRPAWFPEEFDWVVGCSYRGLPEAVSAVRNLFGCNMSFRREVFSTIGDFRLGYGCDETELCIRLRQRWPDKLLLYQPQARVYHYVPAARGTWRHFGSRCYFEGGSKAVVARLRGGRDGLATERSYVWRTLPRGAVRGVADTLRRGDLAGLARTGAIVAGLAATTAGYLMGNLRVNEAARRRGWSGPLQRGVTESIIV